MPAADKDLSGRIDTTMRVDSKNSKVPIVQVLYYGPLLFLVVINVAFAGLSSLGRWELDEYQQFSSMRTGLPYLLGRFKWSPRPISETMLYVYGILVNHFHRQLIFPFLGFLWLIFLSAGLLTSWQKGHSSKEDRAALHLLLSLALMALFLAGGHTTEVFYWPAGAVAYLPTLAATLLLFLQVVGQKFESARDRALSCVCLTVAAGSSECGATFVICYAVIKVIHWSIGRRNVKLNFTSIRWWAAPTMLALVVLIAIRMNRFNVVELSSSGLYRGRPVASLLVGFKEMTEETVGKTMIVDLMGNRTDVDLRTKLGILFSPQLPREMLLDSRLPMDILIVVALSLSWSRLGRMSRKQASLIVELVAALLLASLLTVAAACLHFGFVCCDRHELIRECWITMSIAGLAIASSAWISDEKLLRRSKYSNLGPILLCLAVVSLGQMRALVRTYRDYAVLSRAIQQNAESGFRTDTQDMTFFLIPSTGIITQQRLTAGTFTSLPSGVSPWEAKIYPFPYFILEFFDKQKIAIISLETQHSAPYNTSGICGDCSESRR